MSWRAEGMVKPANGPIMSANEISSSACRIAVLIFCQLVRVGQKVSSVQAPPSESRHEVSAMGPSTAVMISVTRMSAGERASV